MDRLRTSDRSRLRLDRLERLQGLTSALSAAATPEEVAAIIFSRGLDLLGARSVTLYWEREPGGLELIHGLGLSEAFVARYGRLGRDARIPSAQAWRTGEAVWIRSPEEMAARFPDIAEQALAEGDLAVAAIPLGVDRARGSLGLRFDTPRAFDPEEQDFVLAVARHCAQALERARLFDAQRQLADRLRTVQTVTAELSAALTPREVAAVVFRALLGLGARDGGIFRVTEPGWLDLLHTHAADPDTAQRLAHLPLAAVAPPADAARTGEPVWLVTPDAIRAAYPELEPLRARRGDGAWVAMPLRLEGHSVGALAFTLPEGQQPREGDRAFVGALADQCAQALERARLFEAQRRTAERLAQLHSTAAALSGAETPTRVAETAFRGLAALGATSAEIHALEGPDHLVLVARHGPAGEATPAPLAVDAPVPAAEVVRTGKAIWLESPREIGARYPYLEEERAARGDAAWAVVPLLAGGATLGALVIGFPEPRRFDADEKAFVRMLAIPCAAALERARLAEAAARSRAEAEASVAILESTFAAAPIGLALFDREMRFLKVNGVLAAANGIAPSAHLGHTPLELLPGIPAEPIARAFREVLERGTPVEHEVSGETPAAPGVTRTFLVSWYPVRIAGRIEAVGVLVRERPLDR